MVIKVASASTQKRWADGRGRTAWRWNIVCATDGIFLWNYLRPIASLLRCHNFGGRMLIHVLEDRNYLQQFESFQPSEA